MYPNRLHAGIILEPADVPHVQEVFNTVSQYRNKTESHHQIGTFSLPEAAVDGEISITEQKALEIEYFAKIGVDALTFQLRCKNYEYDPLIVSSDPLDQYLAQDLETEIVQLEQRAIRLKGLVGVIQHNLDLSLQPLSTGK